MPIVRGPHHTATVRMTNPASGVGNDYFLSWDTQRHDCCGQTWGVWDKDHQPALWFYDSFTLTVASCSQCGACGSLFVPDVDVTA